MSTGVLFAQPRITVRSKDGTPISIIKIGTGPPMVLIHGAASTALSWALVLPELSRKFTLYVMDRRGRSASGDAPSYSVQAEVEDIATVIAVAEEPVTLVAHSYGAFLSVIAASQGKPLQNVSRMILYEPPIYEKPRPAHTKMLNEITQAAEAGDKERVTARFLEEAVGLQAVNLMRSSPAWPGLVALAPTLPREVRAVSEFRPSSAALANWAAPTTMFLGEKSPDHMGAAARLVCSSMANCHLVILEGQGHLAPQQAPALFVAKVLEATGQ